MKPSWLMILIGLTTFACDKSGSDKGGGEDPVPPPPISGTFKFEDGTERKFTDMESDPDCVNIMPGLLASRQVNRGRGIKISIRDEADGTEKSIYCWNPN
ncbi:hypothetical protein [Oligoflexus tunisiensis]|uniref:hypothetical protein n=1 Tax=Oligoflexus tunisiensis TaxID=708132 RepID=UPI00114CB054|nr:hypothetical protein [Oligoflexus tunisiensis]